MELTCTECGEDFKVTEFPYGDDVKCAACGVLLETESEYSYDDMCCWVVGRSKDG